MEASFLLLIHLKSWTKVYNYETCYSVEITNIQQKIFKGILFDKNEVKLKSLQINKM